MCVISLCLCPVNAFAEHYPLLPQDYVSPLGSRSVRTYIRHFPQSIATPYFSPSLPSIDGSPRFSHLKNTRVYIQTGTAELLYTEDLQLTKGMKDEGIDVRLREVSEEILHLS